MFYAKFNLYVPNDEFWNDVRFVRRIFNDAT